MIANYSMNLLIVYAVNNNSIKLMKMNMRMMKMNKKLYQIKKMILQEV